MQVREGRVEEIREANKLEEANSLLNDGWELFAAVPMQGPSARNQGGVRYVRYVLVKRSLHLGLEGL